MSRDGVMQGVGEMCRILNTGGARIHFIGVLGVSMSSLAEVLSRRGFRVSGSDAALCGTAPPLGVDVTTPPEVAIRCADAVVRSLAISDGHPEVICARGARVPVFSRPELLGALMLSYKRRIGVSGTHGKSTTVAMLSEIYRAAGRCPTVLSGARLPTGKAYILGGSDDFIYEACEYRDAFLHFSPSCAIITNVELDHTDYFPDIDALRLSFTKSVDGAERVVLPFGDLEVRRALSGAGVDILTYGEDDGADYRSIPTSVGAYGCRFQLTFRGASLGEISLAMRGRHNILNATAAIAAAHSEGIDISDMRRALSGFSGIERRLEYLGKLDGTHVYYDYAHHPTAIRAAIEALRDIYGGVAVLFRPHTYTRTRDLWRGFVSSLSLADEVGIYEIYAAREACIDGVTAERLAGDIVGAVALSSRDTVDFIRSSRSPAAVLMGAGDLSGERDEIVRMIKEK